MPELSKLKLNLRKILKEEKMVEILNVTHQSVRLVWVTKTIIQIIYKISLNPYFWQLQLKHKHIKKSGHKIQFNPLNCYLAKIDQSSYMLNSLLREGKGKGRDHFFVKTFAPIPQTTTTTRGLICSETVLISIEETKIRRSQWSPSSPPSLCFMCSPVFLV